MKATIVSENHNANMAYDSKELIKAYIVLSGNKEIIRVNIYMGRSSQASVVYCNFFVIGLQSGA